MSKEYQYDVVIVGGGPSGSSCGIELQRHGFSCCILDKASFPRNKVCGGLLPEKTLYLLHDIMPEKSIDKIKSDIMLDTTRTISFYHNCDFVVRSSLTTEFVITDRRIFDNYLIDYYKSLGGIIFENITIKKIDFLEKKIFLSNGVVYRYKYLVAADGVNSYVRRQLPVKKYQTVFFIEYDIKKEDFRHNDDLTFFVYHGKQLGWSFPKGKYYNIGLGFPVPEENAVKIAESFMKEIGVSNIERYTRKGAMLPNLTIDKPYWGNQVLFVGDAGGFSEPMTGEGIYQALFSGQMAAISILGQNNVVKTYAKLTKTLYQSKKVLGRLQSLFYHHYRMIFSHLQKNPYSIHKFVDGHIGKRMFRYSNMLSFLISYKLFKEKL